MIGMHLKQAGILRHTPYCKAHRQTSTVLMLVCLKICEKILILLNIKKIFNPVIILLDIDEKIVYNRISKYILEGME